MAWTDPATQAAATGDVITAGRFNVINNNLIDLDRRTVSYSASVGTSQSTTSTVYTDLATTGPAQAALIGANGRALVSLYSSFQGSAVGVLVLASYQISGGFAYGPSDADSITYQTADPGYSARYGATHLADIGVGASGRNCTFTMKYKVSAGTGTYQDRRIIVTPLGA